jgi:hypothetical protein
MQPGSNTFSQVHESDLRFGSLIGASVSAGCVATACLLMAQGVISPPITLRFSVANGIFIAMICIALGGSLGAVIGALAGVKKPEYPGKRYGRYIHSGGILVSVPEKDLKHREQIQTLLKKNRRARNS